MSVLVKLFNMVIFPVTLVIGILLLISGQTPNVSPLISSDLPLLGLAFPVLFLINFLLLLYWLIQLNWKTLFPAAFLFLNLGQASLYFQWNSKLDFPAPDDAVQKVKVVNYNVGLFGHFSESWTFDSVCEILIQQDADVICLQEVYAKTGSLEAQMMRLKKATNKKYAAVYKLNKKRQYGMVILSDFKIDRWKRIKFKDQSGNMAMYADLILDAKASKDEDSKEGKLRVYNVHLQSFRFNKTDYKTIEKVKNDSNLLESETDGLIQRMKMAYIKRATQVEILHKNIQECQLNKIVVGDFNDVPVSYSYRTISSGLNDAFIERGNGLETTYKGPFPSFRIDYVLYSDPLICEQYESFEEVPGDHKMITAKFNSGVELNPLP
jgi:endonuclease/exonuclease/phosphatase family metal-dependent hydrolase